MPECALSVYSAGDMRRLAALIAKLCHDTDCVALAGDLGVGKTAFAQGFIAALAGRDIDVTSPTFTLVQHYDLARGAVAHYDLYRLKHADELAELGLDEALARGITLIEWPEIAAAHLPEDYLEISIAYGDAPDHRRVTLSPHGGWEEILAQAAFPAS